MAPAAAASVNASAIPCPACPPNAAIPLANTSIPPMTWFLIPLFIVNSVDVNSPLFVVKLSTNASSSSELIPSAWL